MAEYLRFFFGTPRRLLVTMGVIAALAIFSVIFPGVISGALNNLLRELMPLFTAAIFILLIVTWIKFMMKGGGSKK